MATDDGVVGCEDCGLPYGSESWADLCLHRDDWKRISPSGDEGGLLCANCMVRRATQLGMQNILATWNSGPFAAPRVANIAERCERIADVLRGEKHFPLAYESLRLRDELEALARPAAQPSEGAAPSEAFYEEWARYLLLIEGDENATRFLARFVAALRAAYAIDRPVAPSYKAMVDQANDSDCFNACLASITGIPLVEFPLWTMADKDATGQWNTLLALLRKRGWTMFVDFSPPAGWSVAHGKSPRGDWHHSVVYRDGRLAHDPHPSRAGLVGAPESYSVVVLRTTPLEGKP